MGVTARLGCGLLFVFPRPKCNIGPRFTKTAMQSLSKIYQDAILDQDVPRPGCNNRPRCTIWSGWQTKPVDFSQVAEGDVHEIPGIYFEFLYNWSLFDGDVNGNVCTQSRSQLSGCCFLNWHWFPEVLAASFKCRMFFLFVCVCVVPILRQCCFLDLRRLSQMPILWHTASDTGRVAF